MTRTTKTWAFFVAAVALGTSAPRTARGETEPEYLRRVALLLDFVNHAVGAVESHLEDAGFGRAAQLVAERYVEVTSRLSPPADLRGLHPHVVLVAENAERACYFAGASNMRSFRHHMEVTREEMHILFELLHAQHLDPPRL